MKMTNTTSY